MIVYAPQTLFLRSILVFLMICLNRKTRVFDLSGHETFIARQSDTYSHIEMTSQPFACNLLLTDSTR